MGTILSKVRDREMTQHALSLARRNTVALQMKESEKGTEALSWGRQGCWLVPWVEWAQGKVDVCEGESRRVGH